MRFDWRSLVVSSMMVAAVAARAETRPQYGGAVHVAMRAAPASLDPAELVPADIIRRIRRSPIRSRRRSLTMLMFDTLVTADENGRIQPGLATSWQASPGSQPGNQRWQFRIRRGVRFHDGTPLSAESGGCMRCARRIRRGSVRAEGDSVVIEVAAPILSCWRSWRWRGTRL